MSSWSAGKFLRAPFLYQSDTPIVICPIDDFLIFGPKQGLESPEAAVRRLVGASPDAVLGFLGTITAQAELLASVGRIINLTASTVRSEHSRKVIVHTLDDALRLHASAVAVHINLCSRFANSMIRQAAKIVSKSHRFDMPVIGIVYPRNDSPEDPDQKALKDFDPDAFSDLVAHCVSVGIDLGFDCIKTFWTGNGRTFQPAVSAAGDVPVLIAGGAIVDLGTAAATAREAIDAGAAGISFGRNAFSLKNPIELLSLVRQFPRSKR